MRELLIADPYLIPRLLSIVMAIVALTLLFSHYREWRGLSLRLRLCGFALILMTAVFGYGVLEGLLLSQPIGPRIWFVFAALTVAVIAVVAPSDGWFHDRRNRKNR